MYISDPEIQAMVVSLFLLWPLMVRFEIPTIQCIMALQNLSSLWVLRCIGGLILSCRSFISLQRWEWPHHEHNMNLSLTLSASSSTLLGVRTKTALVRYSKAYGIFRVFSAPVSPYKTLPIAL